MNVEAYVGLATALAVFPPRVSEGGFLFTLTDETSTTTVQFTRTLDQVSEAVDLTRYVEYGRTYTVTVVRQDTSGNSIGLEVSHTFTVPSAPEVQDTPDTSQGVPVMIPVSISISIKIG